MSEAIPALGDALATLDNPMERAALYLAAIAYPGPEDGLPDNAGPDFYAALVKFFLWRERHNHGLAKLRAAMEDDAFTLPAKKDWWPTLRHGDRRIGRARQVYTLYQRRAETSYSTGRVLRESLHGWGRRLRLDRTPYFPNEPADAIKKLKRDVRACLPALHLVYGLERAIETIRENHTPLDHPAHTSFSGRGFLNTWVPAFSMPDIWIDRAIADAEAWRRRDVADCQCDLKPMDLVPLIL